MIRTRPIAEYTFDRPCLSICCATFNHAPYIAQTLEGFLEQETDFPVEILIHDDCSTDGTREIVQTYAERYPQCFRLSLPLENQYSLGVGVMANLRKQARGDFIALCEGDDFWTDPTKLQKQVSVLRNNPDFVMTGHDYVGVDADGKQLSKEDHIRLLGAISMPTGDLTALELKTGTVVPRTCTRVFRNVPLPNPPEKDKVLGGDMFLSSLLGQHGGYHHVQGIKPAVYRVHEGGVWNGLQIEQRQKEALNTFHWMQVYYDRIGDAETAQILARKQTHLRRRLQQGRLLRPIRPFLGSVLAVRRKLRAMGRTQ
jgi:glycosyltransferase involved in cell wall biosynthesis